MITQFNKSDVVSHYKKMFSECVDDGDFEDALDYLLKYRDVQHNDDFHLTCGMLYLQMCLDSSDNKLAMLAYRESMMHLATHPDCENAYRNVLAALLLRRDGEAFIEWCKIIKKRNLDFNKIMGELAESGVLFVMSGSEPLDFDFIFDDYGEIQSADASKSAADEAPRAETAESGKVIAFGKQPTGENAERVKSVNADAHVVFGRGKPKNPDGKTVSFDADVFDSERVIGGGDDLEDFINEYLYGDDMDEIDAESVLDAAELMPEFEDGGKKKPVNADVLRAEDALDRGDVQAALDILARVKKSDESYYFSLIYRAHILTVTDKCDEAERLLDEAMSIMPGSAIGGTILCQLYERAGKTDKIPQALKNIDIHDYINVVHLFKSFEMVIKYCDEQTAEELLREYIDEFNILDMRLAYAQLKYNLGDRDYAIDELYILSRIMYNDISARMMYLSAKSGAEKVQVATRLSDEFLCATVENVLAVVRDYGVVASLLENDEFSQAVDLFLRLSFNSENPILTAMFDGVRVIAQSETAEKRMLEELASPEVELIVKAVILGELLYRSPKKSFLIDDYFCPLASEDYPMLGSGYSRGYYIAYAMVLMLCDTRIGNLTELAGKTDFSLVENVSEHAKALYLVKKSCGKDLNDDRVPFAFGYASKTAAMREYRAIARALK